ncbi:hypothetical protein C8F04DRAFT_1266533 [Mycena alexandri]|uniref:Apple domain-containing protein n=1 Tax=Mycena alexandri TaxID=1745969 RepID=A0AAD6SI87_9AGAR|nr:hypothetical protein C8F04DRAFT_1266533 [Mycena alexandri]
MASRTQILAILSCALLATPSAFIEKKSSPSKREGYDQGGGYGANDGYHNGGYGEHDGYGYQNGGYPNGGYPGGGHQNGGHHPQGGHQNASEVILGFRDPEEFCSQYLSISPYATTQTATQTSTTSPTLVTVTSTSTTNLGTNPTLEDTKTAATATVATTTETLTSTSTEVDTSTLSTSTFYEFTPPPPQPTTVMRRANAAARRRAHAHAARKRDLPLPLRQFDDAEVSSACSDIVMPQTDFQTATTTTTVAQTETDTTTTTSNIPPTTTITATTTLYPEDTETDFSTAPPVTTTTTTTFLPVMTQCAPSRPVSLITTGSDGGKITFTSNIPTADACCQLCFGNATSYCGAWKWCEFDGSCELGVGAMDPGSSAPASDQCPTLGRYEFTEPGAFVGGDGPCSSGQYAPVLPS